ncbi:MAG: SAM-dependent chlorinase/fluorinase [Thermodesulfobacteriota bacterium]|nr:SAM-dependent chlorinase/fluorinase [Thermodesulfobacteriota bacterium]
MATEIPIITLLTDFGLHDEYVGVMKGVVLSINSRVQLVDITHNISRHAATEAALVIKTSFGYFPKGSIHVIVVDPGVGGKRRILCLKKEGHFFVAPDNGVLSLVMEAGEAEHICAVTNEKYFLKPVSSTFHGRDILAPVAAHLSKGAPMASLGEKVGASDVTTLKIPTPYLSSPRELVGSVMSIDHFGNLITNIDQQTLERFKGEARWADLVIRLGRFTIQGLSTSYDAVKKGAPICIMGSRNLLEIALNRQDARTYFKATVGQTIRVKGVA